MKKTYLEAGKIVNTHGVRGEVRILPWADDAEFLRGFDSFYLDGEPLRVISSRVHKDLLIAQFEGYSDVEAAMTLKNKLLYINREDARLPEGSFFIQDMLGAQVRDESGAVLGELVDIINLPASDVYVVKGQREILIPDVPEFIMSTDVENRVVVVRLIEGM